MLKNSAHQRPGDSHNLPEGTQKNPVLAGNNTGLSLHTYLIFLFELWMSNCSDQQVDPYRCLEQAARVRAADRDFPHAASQTWLPLGG